MDSFFVMFVQSGRVDGSNVSTVHGISGRLGGGSIDLNSLPMYERHLAERMVKKEGKPSIIDRAAVSDWETKVGRQNLLYGRRDLDAPAPMPPEERAAALKQERAMAAELKKNPGKRMQGVEEHAQSTYPGPPTIPRAKKIKPPKQPMREPLPEGAPGTAQGLGDPGDQPINDIGEGAIPAFEQQAPEIQHQAEMNNVQQAVQAQRVGDAMRAEGLQVVNPDPEAHQNPLVTTRHGPGPTAYDPVSRKHLSKNPEGATEIDSITHLRGRDFFDPQNFTTPFRRTSLQPDQYLGKLRYLRGKIMEQDNVFDILNRELPYQFPDIPLILATNAEIQPPPPPVTRQGVIETTRDGTLLSHEHQRTFPEPTITRGVKKLKWGR